MTAERLLGNNNFGICETSVASARIRMTRLQEGTGSARVHTRITKVIYW